MKKTEKRAKSRLSQTFFRNATLIALALCLCCSVVFASVLPVTAKAGSASSSTGAVNPTPSTSTTTATVVPGSKPTESTTKAAETAANYVTNLVFDLTILPETTTPEPSFFSNLCTGAVSWIANRALEELVSYVISEDIDVLSDFLIAIQSPATRAEMQHKAIVKQIAQIVKDIQVSVNKISGQLEDLADELDKYETAAAYERAAISLRDKYTQDYQGAWVNYQQLVDAGLKLKDLEENYPEESRTELQKAEIEAAEASVQLASQMFIESAKGLNFLNDIQSISGSFWDPNNKTSSYLGAYEAFLRERYPFEHQIVDALAVAIESCIDMYNEMYLMYTEYYTYLKAKAEEAGDTETYKLYTENYFNSIKYSITKNVNAMVESMGVSSWLVEDELTQQEIDAAMNIYPDFTKPETIQYKVKINGTTYNAYRVRSNEDLQYYVILKKSFTGRDLVTGYSITERSNGAPKFALYRPEFMFNGLYTDDGQFMMISSLDDMSFISKDWTNLRAALRDDYGGNLSGISSDINKVLLYNYEWPESVGTTTTSASWQMKFNSVDLSDDAESVSARTVYDANKNYQVMVVYKDIVTGMSYDKTGTKKINDVANLSGRVFNVSYGQTLDISGVDKDATNVMIYITGSCKIKSNANIKLNSSNIVICNTEKDDVVEFENVNVVATKNSEAALKIKSSCIVQMTGTNTFVGTECISSTTNRDDFYMSYTKTRPIFACHGIITDGNVTLTGGGKVVATGKDGGAGVCFNSGNLTIDNLTLEATGSTISNDVITAGAGIGSCVSFYVETYIDSTTWVVSKKNTFISKKSLIYRGDSGKTSAGTFSIVNSTVSATGGEKYSSAKIEKPVLVEDIGGVELTVGVDPTGESSEWHYYCLKDGSIKNSTVNTGHASLTSRLNLKDDGNVYDTEEIKISAFTKGSNGVTSDGISFKLYGTKGESGWIKAEDIGKEKGDSSQIVSGKTVGTITSVDIKANADNSWWAGKITIECLYSGNSVTLYGGRWIGSSGKNLKPTDNVYAVTVTTGTEDGAGTDADISLYLKDKNGETTNTVALNEISQFSNAFENGDTETFYIYAPDKFEECTYAYFYSNHKWAKADWLLQSFKVEKVSGTTADAGFTHNSAQWLTEDKTVCFGKYSGYTGQFYLEVKTSDRSGAGTDSSIFLTIYGDKGDTGEVNIGKYAGDGNNFERNDKDCFNVVYDSGTVGTINKIVIRKDNGGVGPDWYCDYIIITEKVAEGQKAQCVKFSLNKKKIEDKSYTFDSSYISSSTRKSSQTVSREILSNLEKHEDGSFSLDVDSTVVLSEEAFALVAENNAIFTLNMKNGEDQLLYSVTFDGSKFDSHKALEFKSGYSSSNGHAIIDFLANAQLPAGTILKVNAAQLGFSDNDSICVLKKGENGWSDEIEVENKDGMLTLNIEDGKQLLLKEHGAAIPSSYEVDSETKNTWIWILISLVVVVAAVAAVIVILKKRKQSEE